MSIFKAESTDSTMSQKGGQYLNINYIVNIHIIGQIELFKIYK